MAAGPSPEQIASALAHAIGSRALAPGTQLIQEDLAQRFGVSRNPLREALRLLQSQGLITMTQGGGARVRERSRAELEELYDLRLALEPMLAPALVANIRGRDLDELADLVSTIDAADGLDAWLTANTAFHARLYALAERPHTETILRGLLAAVQPYSRAHVSDDPARARAQGEHALMVDALERRDADGLAAVMRAHLQQARDALVADEPRADPVTLPPPSGSAG